MGRDGIVWLLSSPILSRVKQDKFCTEALVWTELFVFPTHVAVLKDTFDAMSNIKDNNICVDVLDSTLASMGIILTEEELRELLASVTIAGEHASLLSTGELCA